MNTPADDGNDNLRYAEYVLGVLDADSRAAVAHEVATTSEAAVAVALWQRRLTPLADPIDEVVPAPYVWARIRDSLQLDAAARRQPRKGLWDNVHLWRWFGLGAGAVAAALLVVVYLPRPAFTPTAVNAGYMASTLQQDNGSTGWTATMDLQNARMVVVPATPVAFAQGRAPELWLIPAGANPIAVGMIAPNKPTTLALGSGLLARLGPTAALAVSVEPVGGSPTGQPTGPVIAKGTIGAAPDAGAGKVAVSKVGRSAQTSV
jgi:anti-sigma-K factor RskA